MLILPMQLKLSICHPLVVSVTLAHSGGGEGDGGEGDGGGGRRGGMGGGEGDGGGGLGLLPAAKSIGNHCGETMLGFDEVGLMWPDPASLNTLRAFALSSEASSVREPPESERCTTCRRE